jgi:hypothetical protein
MLKHPTMLTGIWLGQLFEGGETSAMQRMFQRNPADTHQYPGPGAGGADISAFLHSRHGQMLLKRSKLPADDFKLPTVMLPFMAAFDAYAGHSTQWQATPAQLFSLRNARQFDSLWFDSAYALGLALAQADSLQK